ncbi:MAG: DUF423 domain-containing protein [Granulosicoccus sp.]
MLITGAIMAALAVMLGAFGAHALQDVLDERARGWFETAASYHTQHALALIASGLLAGFIPHKRLSAITVAAFCFLTGILFFSGSLYLMAFTGITQLGMVTPLGGLFFISGWLAFAYAATRLSNRVP